LIKSYDIIFGLHINSETQNRLGAGGAALFPFLTGQVAGKFGILIMPTACIIMSVMMLALWIFLPSDKTLFAKLCH
jgi:hypothetical protein